MEKEDGTYYLEGRDWFLKDYDPAAGGRSADETAAMVEVLRRKWLFKQMKWLEGQYPSSHGRW